MLLASSAFILFIVFIVARHHVALVGVFIVLKEVHYFCVVPLLSHLSRSHLVFAANKRVDVTLTREELDVVHLTHVSSTVQRVVPFVVNRVRIASCVH